MSEPRFKKGQMVVVSGLKTDTDFNGHIATVTGSEWGCNGTWTGWFYLLGSDQLHHYPEYSLRPYDPPADWNDEDMVWVPDALKEKEAV